MATATAVLDPTQFVTEIPDDAAPGAHSLNDMVQSATFTADDLPVEHIPLEEVPNDDALTPAEQAELAAAQLPDSATRVEPQTPVPVQPSAELLALQAMNGQIARLEAELQALRSAPQQPQTPTPQPTVARDALLDELAQRHERAFTAIEAASAEDPEFAKVRAREYAQSIYDSVVAILGADAAQERIQAVADRVATTRVQEGLQHDRAAQTQQTEADRVFQAAVAQARTAGYDVHHFNAPEHRASKESRQFWALANTVYEPGMTPEQEITATLALMPEKAPQTSAPTPTPRPQPMGRGATPMGVGATTTTPDTPYQPVSMNGAMAGLKQINRIAG